MRAVINESLSRNTLVTSSADVADSTSTRIQRAIQRYSEGITMALLRCTGLVQKWHALVPPCAPLCCKYRCWWWLFWARPSTRRRDAVCAPFQRTQLTTHTFFASKYRRCQRTRLFSLLPETVSQNRYECVNTARSLSC